VLERLVNDKEERVRKAVSERISKTI
jgi:hypothetical protein